MRRFEDVLRSEIKPREILRAAHDRHQTDDPPAPMSWIDYKNRLNLAAFRQKWGQRL